MGFSIRRCNPFFAQVAPTGRWSSFGTATTTPSSLSFPIQSTPIALFSYFLLLNRKFAERLPAVISHNVAIASSRTGHPFELLVFANRFQSRSQAQEIRV